MDENFELSSINKLAKAYLKDIYPVITDIQIVQNGDRYDSYVKTTIPENITMKNYWSSEYAAMDFSYMMAYHLPHIGKYLGINIKPNNAYVFDVDGKLIGEF